MSLEKQMKTGEVYVEFGHTSPEDIAYEKAIEAQRIACKERCFAYNQTPPSDIKRREEILRELLGGAGSVVTHDVPPNTVAYGVPCRSVRAITQEDLTRARSGVPINEDWDQ